MWKGVSENKNNERKEINWKKQKSRNKNDKLKLPNKRDNKWRFRGKKENS